MPSTTDTPQTIIESAPFVIPGIPEIETLVDERLYIIYYRAGNNPNLTKVFRLKGDLKAATLRARKHCLLMGYTFIYVKPFIYDLDEQEKLKEADPEFKEFPR